ncbi:hypothetical protein AAHB53_24520 [Niallia circulans]
MNVWQRMRNNLIKLMNITFFKIILFILLGVILFFTLYGNVKPEKLNVQLFSVADQTIRSPITVEDKESTEKKKEEAKNQVQDVYVVNKEIAQNRVDLISSIFDSVTEVNNEVEKQMEEKRKKAEEEDKNKQSIKEPSVDEKLELLKGKLTNEVTNEIMDRSLKSLIPYSEDQLEIAKDITVTAIHTVMNGKIPSDEVENAKKEWRIS